MALSRRFFVCVASCLLCGCTLPDVRLETEVAAAHRYERELEKIRRDPEGLLRRSLAASQQVRQFTAEFRRQERLGLFFESLRPAEHLRVHFRSKPFSVHFTWLDDDSEFTQCAYVQGANEGQVILMPRKGLLGLPPRPVRYPVDYAVKFARCKSPVTDFGPLRLMERLLSRVEKAKKFGGAKFIVHPLTYYGEKRIASYFLEIHFPQEDEFKPKLIDVYVQAETLLPVATYIWLPAAEGEPPRSNRTLDAMYAYENVDCGAELNDNDFSISSASPSPEAAGAVPEN